jgi:hypothetical protein
MTAGSLNGVTTVDATSVETLPASSFVGGTPPYKGGESGRAHAYEVLSRVLPPPFQGGESGASSHP